jgi:hypothetical protein
VDDFDADTTLIRHGREAVTFTDMVNFARDLEERPLIRLLDEIPSLAVFPDAKFALARMILRRRFRGESPVDQLQLQTVLEEMASTVDDPEIASRVRTLFAPDTA